MANVRLLRQQVQDYQRKLEGINRGYQADYRIYRGDVEVYNQALEKVKQGGNSTWLPNADGTYSLVRNAGGQPVYQGGSDMNVPMVDSLPPKGSGPNRVVVNVNGRTTNYVRGSAKDPWVENVNLRGHPSPYIARKPEAPDEPDATPSPNLTEKEKGLLRNPTAGPSEMVMANAKGVAVASSLAGDQPAAPNSAFANPDDPNNLKERGVLARVLGGQL